MGGIIDKITEFIKELLQGWVLTNFETMFTDVNDKVGTIAGEVSKTPSTWNSGIFDMIKTLSDNVMIPIAGMIISFVLVYELISMVIDKNNLHDFNTAIFIRFFMKACIAVMLLSKTFDIVMAVFDVGSHIVNSAAAAISGENCDLRCLQYLQEQGLMASAPIGCNETGIERTLSTKSTAILVPFCTQELFMPAPAIYYGLNALSNNMIMADRKRLRTPNGVILGTPGSGKSFSAKREILSCFLITKDDIIICDPEGEYFALVAALHGQVVKLATNSKDYLNPMDIQLSHKRDKEALKLKSDFIITLCDLIAGGKDGLQNDEKGIIDECIRHIYDKYFENPVPENMPLLEDLYDALLAHKNPKAERIANSLVLYVHGSQNYFNHHTNVDSGNRIMCFDIRDLGNQLKELGMLIVQDAVWNRVSQNRERKIATRYYCDEFHLLLKEKQTAIYSVEIWKRFRKWGGIPTGLTQNVGDFLRSEEIEGILGNSDFVYLLNQNAKDQAILADKLGLSDKQLSYVTNSEPGSGLILFDNVVIPFVDKYPTDTKTYRIMNTKPEESVQKEDAV